MSNLLYNVSPTETAEQGWRPAYLFELLRRAAARTAAAAVAPPGGDAGQEGATSGQEAGGVPGDSWQALRGAVAHSQHVGKVLSMWTSAQVSSGP